jgi:stage III sporulation protein AB
MMWLRFLLSALLFAVCAWIGRAKAKKLDLRTKALGDLMKLCRQFEALIRVSGRTIPDALAECSNRMRDTWTGGFAGALAKKYGARRGSSGLWAAALKETAKEFEEAASLDQEDVRAVSLFGDQLASADMRSIGEGFTLLYGMLGEQMRSSDKDRAVKGRLYGSIGLLAGLAAAIVVL